MWLDRPRIYPYDAGHPLLNRPLDLGDSALTSAKPAPLNRLRQLWREGRPTFGAIATIPSIQTVQIMARSGIDWIIVDLEHGPIDLGSAHAMITATAGTPCVPMVRIAANEPWLAKAPMDLGALGINFPMICSRADAEKAVRSVPIAGVARTAEQANSMIERGYVALAFGFDWSLFQRGIAASFAGIKR